MAVAVWYDRQLFPEEATESEIERALEKLASEQSMAVKEFVLKFVSDVNAIVGRERGYAEALEDFANDPLKFRAKVRELHKGDIALFEVPCKYCGEPIAPTHRDEDWEPR